MTNWLRSVFAPQRTISVPPLPPAEPWARVEARLTPLQTQHAERRQIMRAEAEAHLDDAHFVMTSMTADMEAIEAHMAERWEQGAGLAETERHMRQARELAAAVYRLSAFLVELRETCATN